MAKNKNHSFNKNKMPSPAKGVITDKEVPDSSTIEVTSSTANTFSSKKHNKMR